MLSFFDWLFHHEYYAITCVVASFILFVTSIPQKQMVLFILFIEFAMCNLMAFLGMEVTTYLKNHAMFLVYFLIQTCAVYALAGLSKEGINVPFILVLLIAAPAIYNLLMIAPYYKYTVFGFSGKQMHGIYINLLGFIMLIQLFYMLMFNNLILNRFKRYGGNNTMFIDGVTFCSSVSRCFHIGAKV